jgi:hypothetical protein
LIEGLTFSIQATYVATPGHLTTFAALPGRSDLLSTDIIPDLARQAMRSKAAMKCGAVACGSYDLGKLVTERANI